MRARQSGPVMTLHQFAPPLYPAAQGRFEREPGGGAVEGSSLPRRSALEGMPPGARLAAAGPLTPPGLGRRRRGPARVAALPGTSARDRHAAAGRPHRDGEPFLRQLTSACWGGATGSRRAPAACPPTPARTPAGHPDARGLRPQRLPGAGGETCRRGPGPRRVARGRRPHLNPEADQRPSGTPRRSPPGAPAPTTCWTALTCTTWAPCRPPGAARPLTRPGAARKAHQKPTARLALAVAFSSPRVRGAFTGRC